jgi:hypothetical protein
MAQGQASKRKGVAVAAAIAVFAVATGGAANACSLASHADNGRYVGGDLTTQIAAKAESIQIVRVTARYLVSRTYAEGSWYLDNGDLNLPAGYSEYTDEFVFKLEPVETLKAGRPVPDYLQDGDLRVRGFSPAALSQEMQPTNWSTINALPDWLPERPGDQGYAFIGASEEAGLGGGQCSMPYVLDIGQTLLALRDSAGRLYPASGAFPLEIDTEFLVGRRDHRRLSINMQSLIPVSGPDDPFVTRLRQALASRPNQARN